jgi:hypothetical protein
VTVTAILPVNGVMGIVEVVKMLVPDRRIFLTAC